MCSNASMIPIDVQGLLSTCTSAGNTTKSNTSKFCITTQLPQQRHRLSGKHSSKTSPITPHYERSQASNQVFRSVFQEGRWNFDPTELIPEIVRIFNLPRTTVLISRKPPNLTQPIFNQVAFNCQPGF